MGRVSNLTVVVTGGGSGIGRGIAEVLAREDARLAVSDVDPARARDVAVQLGGSCLGIEMDVTDRRSVEQGIAAIREELGEIDVLVNNAGVAGNAHLDVVDESESDWDLTFDVNVKGVMRCVQTVVPSMRERRRGSIVNVASVAAHAGRHTSSPYAVSKAALHRYTTGLAAVLAENGIRVNAVCPGAVWSGFQEGNIRAFVGTGDASADAVRNAFEDRYAELIPLGRVQTAEEVGQAVAFLASEDARSITGQCLHVDGGMILRD